MTSTTFFRLFSTVALCALITGSWPAAVNAQLAKQAAQPPQASPANPEGDGPAWKPTREIGVKNKILDVAFSADGKRTFVLTPGEILVYGPEGQKQRSILVDPGYTNLRVLFVDGEDNIALFGSPASAAGGGQKLVVLAPESYPIFTDGLPFKGPANAPVTLAVVSDYQCPSCAQFEQAVLPQLLAKYPGQIKVVFKTFPISSHEYARPAGLAALAAWRQGKFEDFHKRLFENQDKLSDDFVRQVAKDVGMDMARFEADWKSPELAALLEKDIQNAKDIGVMGTPSLYVNGKMLRNRSMAGLTQLIEQELARAQKK